MVRAKRYGSYDPVSQSVREILNPLPVDGTKIPKWILPRIKAVNKTKNYRMDQLALLSPRQAIDELCKRTGNSWADHLGKITWDGYELLSAEPYAWNLNAQMLKDLESFCNEIGASYQVNPNSNYYPGRTIQLIVVENVQLKNELKKFLYFTAEANARSYA